MEEPSPNNETTQEAIEATNNNDMADQAGQPVGDNGAGQPNQGPAQRAAEGRFKMPMSYDNARPKFDGATATSLTRFLEGLQQVFEGGGITEGQPKKEKALSYLDNQHLKDGWRSLPGYDATRTYDEWVEEIRAMYPELEEVKHGSRKRLQEICAEAYGCEKSEAGRFLRFGMFFRAEGKKLELPPAQVTNMDMVGTILETVSPAFRRDIEVYLDNPASITALLPNVTFPAQPANFVNRREDRVPWETVLDVAVELARTHRPRIGLFGGGGTTTVVKTTARALPPAIHPRIVIKQETDEKVEGFAMEIAAMRDVMDVREKQFEDTLKRLESSLTEQVKVMAQSAGRAPPAPVNQLNPGNDGETDNRGYQNQRDRSTPYSYVPRTTDIDCFWCMKSGHMAKDCPRKAAQIDDGKIIIEGNGAKLSNGSYIPKYPLTMSRADKVDDWFRKQGNTAPAAPVQGANFHQVYHNDMFEGDAFEQSYDTSQDELRSAKAQLAIMQRRMQTMQLQQQMASLRQTPPHMDQGAAGSNRVDAFLSGGQGLNTVAQPPFVQRQSPSHPQMVDVSQFLSALQAGMGSVNAGPLGTAEQFAVTRSVKGDAPGGSNF